MIPFLALRNLSRNRRRTMAMLLTIAIGACGLSLFHGFNMGVHQQYRDNVIHARYGNGQMNTPGYRDGVFEKPWDHWISGFADIANKLQRAPGLVNIFPRVSFPALLQAKNISVSGFGQGIDARAESKFFTELNVESGKNLFDEPNGILLGKGLARSLDVKVGDVVTVLGNNVFGSINGVELRVVGIFHIGIKDFDDVVFRLPITQAQKLLETDKVETLSVGLDPKTPWSRFAEFANRTLPALEVTSFEVLDELYYQHTVNWLKAQFRVILSIVTIIVFFGIVNTVSAGVLERRQEIGNLRANGESQWDVMKLLLAEGVILGVVASVLGVGLAWTIAHGLLSKGIAMPPAPGITRMFTVKIDLQPMFLLTSIALGTGCAIMGVLWAGIKVVRSETAVLLRSI